MKVALPAEIVDVILLRDGSRYSAVENGRLRYSRNPTWSWNNTSGYTPTSEEIAFVENMSNEFSATLGSVPGINYGSLTKVNSGGTIFQKWFYEPGAEGGLKIGNTIAYNAARIRPNTSLGRSVVWAEWFEMCIGLDDILGHDSSETICDASGNLNQEGKDLLFYVFAKE